MTLIVKWIAKLLMPAIGPMLAKLPMTKPYKILYAAIAVIALAGLCAYGGHYATVVYMKAKQRDILADALSARDKQWTENVALANRIVEENRVEKVRWKTVTKEIIKYVENNPTVECFGGADDSLRMFNCIRGAIPADLCGPVNPL